jgi:hypothetical protein
MMEGKPPESPSLQQEAVSEKTSSARLKELAGISPELARLVASNPGATPELLRELVGSRDAITRQNVAANPNTPTEVLLNLGEEFTEEVLNNPVFSLLFLENPNIINEMPVAALRNILKQEGVPVAFLEWGAHRSDAEVQLAVAMNAQTPSATLEKLAKSRYSEVAEAAMLHVNLAGEIAGGLGEAEFRAIQNTTIIREKYGFFLEKVSQIGAIPYFAIQTLPKNSLLFLLIASNPHTPGRTLEELLKNTDWEIRHAVAANPGTPARSLALLCQDKNWWVRWEVARNPNTPARVLEHLAVREVREEVQLSVVTHAQTPVPALQKLLKSRYGKVASVARLRLDWAGDKKDGWLEAAQEIVRDLDGVSLEELAEKSLSSEPASWLEEFLSNNYLWDRLEIAGDPHTPDIILEQLAKEDDFFLDWELALNRNTPGRVLQKLAENNHYLIRRDCAANPNTPASALELLGKDRDSKVCENVASNPNTPVSILEHLMIKKNPGVRQIIASNPNIPASILDLLVKDNDSGVRQNLALNPSTPVSILEQLLSDGDSGVRQVSIAPYLAKKPEGLPLVLEHYSKDYKPSFNRILLLLHPEIPAQFLAENVRSSVWIDRYAVAQHPNTPLNQVEVLARDSNRIVRAAAKANLQRRS